MYNLIDIVVEVEFTGVDPIYGPVEHEYPIGFTKGTMVVTYNNGPRSLFALRPSRANKLHLKTAVMSVGRGKVLDAIETRQRFKDGDPSWLTAAKTANKRPCYL